MACFGRIIPFLIVTLSVFIALHEHALIFPAGTGHGTAYPASRWNLSAGVLAKRCILCGFAWSCWGSRYAVKPCAWYLPRWLVSG